MVANEKKELLLEEMLSLLDLPEGAYEKAQKRYENIGNWLIREESKCALNDPQVFPQGSFRLGTAIRPLDDRDEYDLDLACNLRVGITKQSHSQEVLKVMIGAELEAYRVARGVEAPLEEKHRCWRLEYADTLNFHMDIVPCIPAESSRKGQIFEAITNLGGSEEFATAASETTVAITDDRHPGYPRIDMFWNISNPQGYAAWFEDKMNLSLRAIMERAQVDNIPIYKRKTPLQRIVQLLKRHRDQMFKDDPEVKPISIIITTLAARAYRGERDVATALYNVLENMDKYVNPAVPRVPNPVDPGEDFADRWSMPEYSHLSLEENFINWLTQARNDFILITEIENASALSEQLNRKFSLRIGQDNLVEKLGLSSVAATPAIHTISEPPKPWRTEKY